MDQKLIFQSLGLHITNFQQSIESQEYTACSFHLNGKVVEFRTAKITPTKVGQFVTFWKRSESGPIMPFDIEDQIDFFMVEVIAQNRHGLFIFPKSILVQKGVMSVQGVGGKRAIRVYPSWDRSDSKQAVTTQTWQAQYFSEIALNGTSDIIFIKKLLRIEN